MAPVLFLTEEETMGESYKDLLSKREALDEQIAQARAKELAEAVERVRAIIAEYGLTEAEVFGGYRGKAKTAGAKVAPKYRDPQTGKTWTGRGKPPSWIAGKEREQFLIG